MLTNDFKTLQFALQYSDEASRQFANQLGQRLGLEPHNISEQSHDNTQQINFLFLLKEGILSLRDLSIDTEIVVDFSRINKSRLSKKLQLAKAVGFKGGAIPSVIDATAGMGRDAYTLAALGATVSMIEQSPIIAELLKNGLERQKHIDSETISTMTLHEGNAAELIPNLKSHDVIYLDPMYADRAKQALPKKEMQIFRKLLGHDDEVDNLLEVALQHAKKRVVVKRHRTAKPLLDMKPHAELVGKQTRFDIYLK